MSSVADIPSEARCKQLMYELAAQQKHHECSRRIAWRRGRDYGWCRVCRVKVLPKAATWFRNSNLGYRQLFYLLASWQARQSPGSVRMATGLSYTTIQRRYARFREHLPPDGDEMLSGVVAVDEAWFGKQRHARRGRQTIVMGGIEVDTRRLRLQVIPDTEQDSIELFLQSWVAKGSHLITDAHASYQGVEWLGYSREAYNHSAGHFGMTNHIECIWSAMKRHLRKLYGCVPTQHLGSFLREWEARHNQRELFESPLAYLRATLVVTD